MTIRDVALPGIKDPEFYGGMLYHMFLAKKDFIVILQPVEDFTDYPLKLDQKENQLIIKDFIGRITEELMEAFTPLMWLTNIAEEAVMEENSQVAVIQTLYELNEELADVLHFYIEMMILVGLDVPDILDHIYAERDLSNLQGIDDLAVIAHIIKEENILSFKYAGTRSISNLNYKLVDKDGNSLIPTEIQGGTQSGSIIYQSALNDTFNIIYLLNILRGKLKKKQWRDNEDKVEQNAINTLVLGGFKALMSLFEMIGYTPYSMYDCYLRKNVININRINEKIKRQNNGA